MESPWEYFMCFPSVPISSLSDLEGYASLPRRDHLYLGETVQFLLVLRFRKRPGRREPLTDLAGSLSAQASACIAEGRCQGDPRSREDDGAGDPTGLSETGDCNVPARGGDTGSTFRQCGVALIHSSAPDRQQNRIELLKVRKTK